MLSLFIVQFLVAVPNANAQTQGTVPIEVTRLPEYPEEKPKTYDPVAAPVKSFGFENSSANGWYAGEGASSTPKRKATATTTPKSEYQDPGTATTEADEAPYVEASNAGSSSSLSSTSSTSTTTGTTSNRPFGGIDCDTGGIVNCAVYNQNRGAGMQQVNSANQLANDKFNAAMGNRK